MGLYTGNRPRVRPLFSLLLATLLVACGAGSESVDPQGTEPTSELTEPAAVNAQEESEPTTEPALLARVRSLSESGVGPWSDYFDPTVVESSAPDGVLFDGGAFDKATLLEFRWQPMLAALLYEIKLYDRVSLAVTVQVVIDPARSCSASGCLFQQPEPPPSDVQAGVPDEPDLQIAAQIEPQSDQTTGRFSLDWRTPPNDEIDDVLWHVSGTTPTDNRRTDFTHAFTESGRHTVMVTVFFKSGTTAHADHSLDIERTGDLPTPENSSTPPVKTASGSNLPFTPPAAARPEVTPAPARPGTPTPPVETTEASPTPDTAPEKPAEAAAALPSTPTVELPPAQPPTVEQPPIEPPPDLAPETDTTDQPVEQTGAAPISPPTPPGGQQAIGGPDVVTTEPADGFRLISVEAFDISPATATITWTVSDKASGYVEYGRTASYGSETTREESFVYSTHRQSLTELQPGTTYHFRVHSRDVSGKTVVSPDQRFTTIASPSATAGAGDTPAPLGWTGEKEIAGTSNPDSEAIPSPGSEDKSGNTESGKTRNETDEEEELLIQSVSVDSLAADGATISWRLSTFATGHVEYGETSAYGSVTTAAESTAALEHRHTLEGLLPDTQYHYRIHATDIFGVSAVSVDATFTTLPPAETDTHANGAWIHELPPGSDGDLPMAGVFYGNPIGGVGTANAPIAVESSRRFRAERSGQVQFVRYHNRVLYDRNIKSRCDSNGPSSEWCKCVNAGLDGHTCGYTLGSSYSVGNGGRIVIELRPDNGAGEPGDEVLASTEPYVPMELEAQWYLRRDFKTPGNIDMGRIYHLVYRNLNPPARCKLSRVAVNEASNCPRNQGAIGLNGVFLVGEPATTGLRGPWYGNRSSANLYKRNAGDAWQVYPKNLSFFELGYTDGVSVGDTYHALDSMSGGKKVLQGSTRGRQRFQVQSATRTVDGVWLYVGHTAEANGSPLSVTLKNAQGQVMALGSLPASAHCRRMVKAGSARENTHCRDWVHAEFDVTAQLSAGEEFTVEFNGSAAAGFIVSTVQSLEHFGFKDRNEWRAARAELSKDGGANWTTWTSQKGNTRDMTLLFTLKDMPRQLP